jgi:catechol 2,3-dioxygenase-like lactoylglutathione lyase family enzyme
MSVLGIETVVYCVDDVGVCTDFFEDFGLGLLHRDANSARFKLPDSSNVVIRSIAEDPVPGSQVKGVGVHEVIWGVDSQEHLDRIVARVAADREVRRDGDGAVRFVADGGIAMGVRLWPTFRMPQTSVDPVNSPGNVKRMNTHRKWIARAHPKRMMHIVYVVPDHETCARFLRERLDFRLSDEQQGVGAYLRCDGASDHHNALFFNSHGPLAGGHGETRFHHVNFHVTDLDEMMVGKNYMERRGWAKSHWGLGRHRISSALFCYLPCPAGGEAEYGADSDQLDDSWVPRDWNALFGIAQWMHDMPAFWAEGHDWEITFANGVVAQRGEIAPRAYNVRAEEELPATSKRSA